MRRWLIGSSLAAALCFAGAARADDELQRSAAAEALFREAKALMGEQRYEEACPKLEQSMKLDPGGGTLLNLGVCHARAGKLATAWVQLHDARAQARREGRDKRVSVAEQEIAALQPRLPRLKLVMPQPVIEQLQDIVLDGAELGAAAYDTAIPLDPGSHRLVLRVRGKLPWRVQLVISEAQQLSVEVPELTALDEPPAPPPAPAPAPLPTLPEPTPAQPAALSPLQVTGMSQRLAGYTIGAAGLLSLTAGVATGLLAIQKHRESNDACPDGYCTALGAQLESDARSFATASNVGFGVGAGLLSLGVVLVVFAPQPETDDEEKPAERDGTARLHIQGRGAQLQVTW